MPAVHGKRTRLLYNQFDLTSYFREVSTPGNADVADTSSFGLNDKTYMAGMRDGRVTGSGLYDPATGAVDEKLSAVLVGAGEQGALDLVAYLPDPTGPGAARARIGQVLDVSYQPSSSIGDAVGFSVEFQCSDTLASGMVLVDPVTNNAPAFATGVSVDWGAAPAYNYPTIGWLAHLHVIVNSYSAGVTYKIRTADDTGFTANPEDVVTFTTIPAGTLQVQRAAAAAGNVRRFTRVERVGGTGGTGGLQMLVVLARKF